MEGTNVSQKTFKVLANYISFWPGQKIGQRGLVTLENETGSLPPLVWVFNSEHEFSALATALGPDQPLVGLRSLNAAVRIDKLITWDERILAAVYAEDLLSFLGDRPFFIGGNCQAAPIAAALARELLLAGCDARGFIAMEWSALPCLPLKTTLLFGEQSEQYNPFLRGLDPRPLWRCIFSDHSIGFLPGAHGTYFAAESIPALADHLKGAVSDTFRRKPSHRAAASVRNVPKTVAAREQLTLAVIATDDIDDQDEVAFLWDCHSVCLPHYQTAKVVTTGSAAAQLKIAAPATAGLWTLQTFRCRPGLGPVAWFEEARAYSQIVVTGNTAPDDAG